MTNEEKDPNVWLAVSLDDTDDYAWEPTIDLAIEFAKDRCRDSMGSYAILKQVGRVVPPKVVEPQFIPIVKENAES